MLGLRATAAQGIAECTSLEVARRPMWASSAGLTAGCVAGSSRNHHQKPAAHAAPTPPKIANVQRQPMPWIRTAARNGAMAPPIEDAASSSPCARPRSSSGNQRDSTRATFGKAPASPAPKRNRTATSVQRPVHAPVSAVKADHQSEIRVSTRRPPIRSPHRPVGTSNSP